MHSFLRWVIASRDGYEDACRNDGYSENRIPCSDKQPPERNRRRRLWLPTVRRTDMVSLSLGLEPAYAKTKVPHLPGVGAAGFAFQISDRITGNSGWSKVAVGMAWPC